jgi:hypothetical protein
LFHTAAPKKGGVTLKMNVKEDPFQLDLIKKDVVKEFDADEDFM